MFFLAIPLGTSEIFGFGFKPIHDVPDIVVTSKHNLAVVQY